MPTPPQKARSVQKAPLNDRNLLIQKAKPREDLAAVAGLFLSETVCKQ